MAMNNQDMNVKTLRTRNAAKQDRIAASGSLAGMRIPTAVLSLNGDRCRQARNTSRNPHCGQP